MEGKIDIGGYLLIERKNKYKDQHCLYNHTGVEEDNYCGDWCPQFGEPEKVDFRPHETALNICQNRVLKFDNFKDERTQDGKE